MNLAHFTLSPEDQHNHPSIYLHYNNWHCCYQQYHKLHYQHFKHYSGQNKILSSFFRRKLTAVQVICSHSCSVTAQIEDDIKTLKTYLGNKDWATVMFWNKIALWNFHPLLYTNSAWIISDKQYSTSPVQIIDTHCFFFFIHCPMSSFLGLLAVVSHF